MKLRQMGTFGVKMKGVLNWLDPWARTAKTQYRKLETNIPRKETEWLHSCFCERFMYIPLIGLPILQQENWWAERGNI